MSKERRKPNVNRSSTVHYPDWDKKKKIYIVPPNKRKINEMLNVIKSTPEYKLGKKLLDGEISNKTIDDEIAKQKRNNKMTQRESILRDLKEGQNITPIDALTQYGCFRLASIICNLKKEGYNIKKNMVAKLNNNGKFASYYLRKDQDVSPIIARFKP